MVRKIFSVFDEKAEAYLQPFFLDTIGLAIRAIGHCLDDKEHQFSRNTADYSLHLLGEFDDSTGMIKTEKKSLGNLVEFKKEDDK